MSRLLKSITMTLDPESIENAIMEIEDAKAQLTECMEELIKYLIARGQEIARVNVVSMDAVFTGELAASGIHGIYFNSERCGVVYTDKWYAIYVEFGTGIVGKNSGSHPMAGAFGWQHDVNGHGANGWWYPAEWGYWIPKKGTHAGQTMAWTAGMPVRPFMYNTLRELEEIAEREGIEFFRMM